MMTRWPRHFSLRSRRLVPSISNSNASAMTSKLSAEAGSVRRTALTISNGGAEFSPNGWPISRTSRNVWHYSRSMSRQRSGARITTRDSRSRCRLISITRSVILGWPPMTSSARRMLVRVSVVVMPDRADVARIGLEEEPGHGVDACRRRGADRTRRGTGRVGHRPLPLVHGPTGGAGIIVFRHGARIGQETRSALEPAVLIHHLFHGECGDAAQNGLAKGTAEDLVDPAALRLRLLSLLSLPGCRLVVSTTEQTAKEIVEGVVVRLTLSAWLLLRHATAKQTTQQPAEHVVRAETTLPLWRLARLRVRVRLGCTTAEETAEETTQHVIHTAASWGSTAALGRMRLTGALDGDHSRASLAPLQHLGEGFALVVGEVADRFHGRALHHLGRGLAANLTQV